MYVQAQYAFMGDYENIVIRIKKPPKDFAPLEVSLCFKSNYLSLRLLTSTATIAATASNIAPM